MYILKLALKAMHRGTAGEIWASKLNIGRIIWVACTFAFGLIANWLHFLYFALNLYHNANKTQTYIPIYYLY